MAKSYPLSLPRSASVKTISWALFVECLIIGLLVGSVVLAVILTGRLPLPLLYAEHLLLMFSRRHNEHDDQRFDESVFRRILDLLSIRSVLARLSACQSASSNFTRTYDYDVNLLARWRFDNGLKDESGNYTGVGAPNAPNFVPGYFGQAADFIASAKQSIATAYVPLANTNFTIDG